ncbi:hypothetical protein LguiA_022590 [Lonicera macranthoides]
MQQSVKFGAKTSTFTLGRGCAPVDHHGSCFVFKLIVEDRMRHLPELGSEGKVQQIGSSFCYLLISGVLGAYVLWYRPLQRAMRSYFVLIHPIS